MEPLETIEAPAEERPRACGRWREEKPKTVMVAAQPLKGVHPSRRAAAFPLSLARNSRHA